MKEEQIRELIKSGKVVYNQYHIDFSNPFEEQLYELTEDLLQIEYKNGLVLDIGWYPEMDPNGCLKVHLIKDADWYSPLICLAARSEREMEEALKEVIRIVEGYNET